MTQKTLVERIAEFFRIREPDFVKQFQQLEVEARRIYHELIGISHELERLEIEQLRGGGSYDLTDGLMSAAEIKSQIQRYFPSTEKSYELPRTRQYI